MEKEKVWGMEGAGAEGDKLVKETMVALGFMFKLFFIKSNLRFNLSSLFLSFSLNGILIFGIQGPQLLLVVSV